MVRYPLATTTWDNCELDAIQDVIDSGMYTMGPRVSRFESAFAEFVGTQYCVMVNSGSSANLLAIAALFYRQEGKRLVRGDEVIVPAVSWPTTYYPLYQYGLKLKFVDIDQETLNYDLDALSTAITSDTKMIVVVNLLGNPNDFSAIQTLIDGRDILLLEDNCESLGAEFMGKQAGTFGVMGTYSAFFSHHISTMEGGLIATDDEELYHILLSLRAHGWTRNLPALNRVTGVKSDDPFDESFKFVLPGYNVRPLEMSGAIGLEQLKKLPEMLVQRRRNAEYFVGLFSNHSWISIQREIGNSSWFGFSFVIHNEAPFERKDIIRVLQANGIECRPIVAGNFTKNQVLQWFNYELHGHMINADYIDRNGFFIGNHHYDISENLQMVKSLIEGISAS